MISIFIQSVLLFAWACITLVDNYRTSFSHFQIWLYYIDLIVVGILLKVWTPIIGHRPSKSKLNIIFRSRFLSERLVFPYQIMLQAHKLVPLLIEQVAITVWIVLVFFTPYIRGYSLRPLFS